VRLDSPGPAIFSQQRVGENGRLFCMYKFRTMCAGAEAQEPHLGFDGQGHAIYKWPKDLRITRVGQWLRRTSLDELPQFFNVLRGQMSVVGPRPERPVFVERFRRTVPGYMLRHKVKSGITGWAQVHGLRGNTSLEKRIQYDLHYIEQWSFWLDLKTIALTVSRVLFDRNAY